MHGFNNRVTLLGFVLIFQIGSLLKHMNDLGISDGVTGSRDQSVDGLPLQVHLDKVRELLNVVEYGRPCVSN